MRDPVIKGAIALEQLTKDVEQLAQKVARQDELIEALTDWRTNTSYVFGRLAREAEQEQDRERRRRNNFWKTLIGELRTARGPV